MSPYIETALNNIQKIVETIDAEKNIDVHLALVEYRDHPPQEDTFVTRVHDFSDSVAEMKKWLEDCSADGGGDTPEAVADGLHALLKLDWCVKSTKIAILICDAPPHGLKTSGDGFPDGCPAGLDPLAIVRELTEKGITLYVVGCEPALVRYKEFFMGLAYATGGQYLPLAGTRALTLIIIGGAQEELSLDHLMEEVDRDVMEEAQLGECADEEEIASRIHAKMIGKGYKAKKLMRNKKAMGSVSKRAQVFSKMTRLSQMEKFLPLPDDYSDTEARDDDEYEAFEETLDIVQIKRMVKKSMARNKVVLPDIVSLREEVLRLRQRIDDLEQNFRRTCLKCCGVPQTEGEDTDCIVINTINDHILPSTEPKISLTQIGRTHTVGPRNTGVNLRSRDITINSISYRDREGVFGNKTTSKTLQYKSRLFINEPLTRNRLQLYRKVRDFHKGAKIQGCWMHNGQILIKTN